MHATSEVGNRANRISDFARLVRMGPATSKADSSVRRSAALPAQLGPIVEALSDLALKAALRRIVKLLPSERFGEIVLARKRFRRVVVVLVAGAVAFLLHQLGRRIEDVLRRQERARLLGDA